MYNNKQVQYWDNIYSNPKLQFPTNDNFLTEWAETLRHSKRIVDLGCGNGINTYYLHKEGIETVACDFSEHALMLLLEKVPNATVLLFDMTKGLPFLSNNIDVFIADLSLHYFSFKDTNAILNEILRSLRPNGLFLCRVNAIDPTISYESFKEIEKDYYDIAGCTKRFFTVKSLSEIISSNGFIINKVFEQETMKYRASKKTIVCAAYKPDGTIPVD